MAIQDKLKVSLESTKQFLCFWKWSESEKQEFKSLVLLLFIGTVVGYYFGESVLCNSQGGKLGSFQSDSFVDTYFTPSCIPLECYDEDNYCERNESKAIVIKKKGDLQLDKMNYFN